MQHHLSYPNSNKTSKAFLSQTELMLVKIFIWTLIQGKVDHKQNLVKKNVLQNATCDLCQQEDEDCDHIILRCPFASSFWQSIGVHISPNFSSTRPWEIITPFPLQPRTKSPSPSYVTGCCGTIATTQCFVQRLHPLGLCAAGAQRKHDSGNGD